ncbi:ABC transporter ATP-binding protein [Streptomyces sp. NPDC055078]
MTTSPPILRVRDLHAWIGESHILHGLDFDVRQGHVTGLLGRNGVGKTTTLRGIIGQVETKGVIEYSGQDITAVETYRISRLGVAYVPEDREIFAGLTVGENLVLADRGRTGAREEKVFGLFPELKLRYRQRAGTLSGGQQQMLALGRALMNDDRLLLVDEPTKGLAPLLVDEVAEALARVAETTTVLLVEQNLRAIKRMVRHCVVIDHGTVAHTGPVDELFDDKERTHRLLGVGESR